MYVPAAAPCTPPPVPIGDGSVLSVSARGGVVSVDGPASLAGQCVLAWTSKGELAAVAGGTLPPALLSVAREVRVHTGQGCVCVVVREGRLGGLVAWCWFAHCSVSVV